MRIEEYLVIVLVAVAVLLLPIATLVMAIIAFARTRKLKDLTARLDRIERNLHELSRDSDAPHAEKSSELKSASQVGIQAENASDNALATAISPEEYDTPIVAAELVSVSADMSPNRWQSDSETFNEKTLPPPKIAASFQQESSTPVGWETFIGQKAFGWVAAVLFLFSATFFLRYAYQNNWISPAGRVAIAEMFGAGLVFVGARYWLTGWQRFASMLLSTGIVVIYLATYSSFGLYQLLPQQHAGIFLVILVAESMLAAVYCRSALIGMIAAIGGLATPLLMTSDHDLYSSLFLYLLTLNMGVVAASILQRWRAVASVTFAGTHLIYMTWYWSNYHPEKFAWALGFQMSLFAMYLGHSLIVARMTGRSADHEELIRLVVNAVLGFAAFRVLTIEYWSIWLGTVALFFSTIYVLVARAVMAWRPADQRLIMASLAISVGFIAWAIPVQADTRWIALGWTVMAIVLWLFGLRISSLILKVMAAALASMAVVRLVGFDLTFYIRDPFVPVFNRDAFPSLAAAGLLLAAVWRTDRYLPKLSYLEQWGIGITGLCGISLVWLVLSLECYGYLVAQALESGDLELWRWRAQLALTIFWIVFASGLLLLGFYFNRSRLRWFAMALYGVTVLKLFIVDMANVQQIYRIVAFFVLAVVLGLVARGYQRFKH